MQNFLAVGLGGFLGSVLRYGVGLIPVSETTVFPVKTFGINVLGCIVIGLLAAAAVKNPAFPPSLLLFLKVGLCGGFTTFSTFALETTDLMKTGHGLCALLYALGSVVVGVGVILAVEYGSVK